MYACGIGDLHLTDHLGNGGLSKYIEDHDAMVCSEVKRVLSYAKRKGIRNIFFYGDFCEGVRMSYRAMLNLSALFADDDFEFYGILGNHDTIGRTPEVGHSLEVFKEMKVASKKNVHILLAGADLEIDNAPVRMLPFPRDKFSPQSLNICHLDVYGAVADNGREILDDRKDKSDSVVLAGHIHTNQRIRNTYYSGTLYQTCFGESLPKFFHVIEFNSINDYEVTSIPFKPKYRLHTLTVQTKADIPLDLGPNDLVKLVLQDGSLIVPDDYKHLNVAIVRNFQTRQQLASVLTEDLPQAGESNISTKEFFKVWLDSVDVEDSLKSLVSQTRRRILSSVG